MFAGCDVMDAWGQHLLQCKTGIQRLLLRDTHHLCLEELWKPLSSNLSKMSY